MKFLSSLWGWVKEVESEVQNVMIHSVCWTKLLIINFCNCPTHAIVCLVRQAYHSRSISWEEFRTRSSKHKPY